METRKMYIDKETDRESSLGDYGVRKYDNEIGRFTSIDPLWEKYRRVSPYNYCGNNPLILRDPTGFGWFEDAVKGAKDIVQGAFDAVASDVTGQDIRTGDQSSDLYRASKFAGHAADVYVGGQLSIVGMGMTVGGGVAAPGTAGASLSVSVAGVGVTAFGAHVMSNATGNLVGELSQMQMGSNGNGGGDDDQKKETVSFTQGRGENAKKVTVEVPEGYKKTNYYSEKQPVYSNGKTYISPDTYGHNGGVWKMAKKVEELKTRGKRLGTYNEKLERIGD